VCTHDFGRLAPESSKEQNCYAEIVGISCGKAYLAMKGLTAKAQKVLNVEGL